VYESVHNCLHGPITLCCFSQWLAKQAAKNWSNAQVARQQQVRLQTHEREK
jgi:hypothetical protein